MILGVTNRIVTALDTDTRGTKQLNILDDVWEEVPVRDGDDGTGPPPGEDDEEDTEEPPPGSEDGNPDPPK